jgi:hypothetical protein
MFVQLWLPLSKLGFVRNSCAQAAAVNTNKERIIAFIASASAHLLKP